MTEITLAFVLHRAFVSDGQYEVFLNGNKASVEVHHEKNHHALEQIFPRFSLINPTDQFNVHGIINICKIKMKLPIASELKNNSNQGYEIKLECMKYLNRLVEVIRYKTGKYWITPVSEYDLLYADIVEYVDESTKKRKQGYIDMGIATVINVPVKNEIDLMSEINDLLTNEQTIYYSDSLILDSYNYLYMGRYNESILISNLSLEIFIIELLKDILKTKLKNDDDLSSALKRVLEKKLHSTVRKNFFEGKKHEELIETSDIYTKFDESRNFRTQVFHYGRKLGLEKSSINLANILEINNYLLNNVSNFSEHIINRGTMS